MIDDSRRTIDSARRWYDESAGTFRQRYTGTSGDLWLAFEETLALEMLDAAPRVLDLGCGPGRLAPSLASRGSLTVGADISMAMIAMARSSAPAGTHYVVMDATRLAFRPRCFDAVISLGMFEYVSDPQPFLQEIRRVLEPGGQLVFTCHAVPALPTRAWIFAKALLRRVIGGARIDRRAAYFTPVIHRPRSMLQRLRETGFSQAEYRGFHFPPAADLFFAAARLPARAARIGMRAAAALDRWIGRRRAAKALAPLAMFSARRGGA